MINCFRTMIREEGVRSLWKGWTAHTFAVLFWMSLLPILTDFMMEKLPLYIDPKQMPQGQKQEDGFGVDENIEYRFDEEDEDDDDF